MCQIHLGTPLGLRPTRKNTCPIHVGTPSVKTNAKYTLVPLALRIARKTYVKYILVHPLACYLLVKIMPHIESVIKQLDYGLLLNAEIKGQTPLGEHFTFKNQYKWH